MWRRLGLSNDGPAVSPIRYCHPPDKQETAIALVMQQAELLATGVAA